MDDKQRAAMEAANPYKDPASADWSSTWRQGYTAAMHAHDAEKLAMAEAVAQAADDFGFIVDQESAIALARRIIAEAKGKNNG